MDNWKTVIHNLDHPQRGFSELKQSTCLIQAPFPQTQTPVVTQMADTLVPMDIYQRKHNLETHTCYNCNEKGHLSQHCPKPQKQQIQSTESTEVSLKSLVAEVVAAALDTWEVMQKVERPKEDF